MQTFVGAVYEREGEKYLIASGGFDDRGERTAIMVCADKDSEDIGLALTKRRVVIKDTYHIKNNEFAQLTDNLPEKYVPTTSTIMAMLEIVVNDNPGVRLTENKYERDNVIAAMQLNGMKCVCNINRNCQCSDVIKVANGDKDECSCGLFVAE